MEDKIPSSTNTNIAEDNSKVSSALVVAAKKPEDLVEEDIDSQILSILGLEDVFDLTYEEYASLLKEAAVKGRMPGSQMTTESVELVTNELKRVKNKTGRFKVKPKKVDINKVLDRKQPTPPGAIVKAQKLIPAVAEEAPEQEKKLAGGTDQEDLSKGIGNILESLITIRGLLQSEGKTEQKAAQEDRKEIQKKKKKERESKLEAKKPTSPILKALTKPVDDFFGAIKRFFTNVLLGSVVLGMFNWLKDPANQKAVDGFSNFLQKNAGLILGGLLAIAVLPLAPTLLALTSAITSIAIPALTSAFAFLASPAGIAALAALAATTAAATLQNVARPALQQLVGGESVTKSGLKFKYEDIVSLRKKAYDFMVRAGAPTDEVNKQLKPYEDLMATMRYKKKLNDEIFDLEKKMKENQTRYRDPKTYENLSPLQEKQLRKRLGEIQKDLNIQYKQKQKEKDRSSETIKAKFEKIGVGEDALEKAITARGGTVGRLGQTVQPQTPRIPGLPPSAAQSGTGPAGNLVGSSSASSTLSKAAAELKGMSSAAAPDRGKNGCVWAVNKVFARAGIKTPWGSSNYVPTAEQEMIKSGYQRVSSPSPGDIYVAPGEAHIGIVLDNGNIISNSSSGAKFSWEASPSSYSNYYGGPGKFYRIPSSVIVTGQPSVAQATQAQVAPTSPTTPSIPSPTSRSNIVPIPIPTGGGAQRVSSGTSPNQAPVPRFSSEDPNNTTTMVVRAIYNIVG